MVTTKLYLQYSLGPHVLDVEIEADLGELALFPQTQ